MRKNGSTYGALEGMITVFHKDFFSYTLLGSPFLQQRRKHRRHALVRGAQRHQPGQDGAGSERAWPESLAIHRQLHGGVESGWRGLLSDAGRARISDLGQRPLRPLPPGRHAGAERHVCRRAERRDPAKPARR
ncbi:hypothetical protein LP420_07060 [Massilia sp. B-10]|nr:hypothetical protein LP420_07060 [Massilia sp. B-10]